MVQWLKRGLDGPDRLGDRSSGYLLQQTFRALAVDLRNARSKAGNFTSQSIKRESNFLGDKERDEIVQAVQVEDEIDALDAELDLHFLEWQDLMMVLNRDIRRRDLRVVDLSQCPLIQEYQWYQDISTGKR
ncbi:hypothetical protein MMC14_003393 [Varicellaria rhodocarpa]|nr:hypothetical protein [Varicellaria rhodocarpa]